MLSLGGGGAEKPSSPKKALRDAGPRGVVSRLGTRDCGALLAGLDCAPSYAYLRRRANRMTARDTPYAPMHFQGC